MGKKICPSRILFPKNHGKLKIALFKLLHAQEFKSNIGLTNEISSNIGGTSNIEGQKIFLYFNGNHVDFENQIKRGVAWDEFWNVVKGNGPRQQYLANARLSNISLENPTLILFNRERLS